MKFLWIVTLCTVFLSVLNLTQSVVNRTTAWHTINLTSRRPGVLHVILIGGLSFLPWEKRTHKTLFPVAHQEHSSTEQHSTTALRYSRYRLTAWFLRDPYEVFTRSVRDRALTRQGSRARQQGTFLIFHSLLYASLITSTLQFDSLLYSSVYSLFYSPLLFYCSLFSVSQAIEKPSPWVSISKRICLRNMCAPAKC